MSAVFAPFGLLPTTQDQIGESYARNYPNSLPATGSSFNLFQGQPLKLDVNGYLAPVTATTDTIVGVFAGLEYVDPTNRIPVVSNKYVSGTQFLGYLDPGTQMVCRVLVYDVQNTIYRIQSSTAFPTPAAGSVPMPQIGEEFNLDVATETVTNPDGSVVGTSGVKLVVNGNFTGNSLACLNAGTKVAATGTNVGQLMFWGNEYLPGNFLTDTYPVVRVKVNAAYQYAGKIPPAI